MYGGKRVGETLAWEEVLSFYIQSVLGSAKEFKLKTSNALGPNHKKASYGAMLGTMCGMHRGKGAGETLSWEEVLSFYIQFCAWASKGI